MLIECTHCLHVCVYVCACKCDHQYFKQGTIVHHLVPIASFSSWTTGELHYRITYTYFFKMQMPGSHLGLHQNFQEWDPNICTFNTVILP